MPTEQHPRLGPVLAYVHENLDHRLTLAELAGQALLSPYHFARVFKNEVDETPHRYVLRARVSEAKRLLEAGSSVAGTAEKCGFSSTAHFSAVFVKETGVRPSRWNQGRA